MQTLLYVQCNYDNYVNRISILLCIGVFPHFFLHDLLFILHTHTHREISPEMIPLKYFDHCQRGIQGEFKGNSRSSPQLSLQKLRSYIMSQKCIFFGLETLGV